jgi:hypothetical protein
VRTDRIIASLGVLLATATTATPRAVAQQRQELPAIADNSFLIEEAYNQEPGVVQHISAFQKLRQGDSWVYTFTQEWPLFGQTSQFSYTVPVQRVPNGSTTATGFGDAALNYRYQLVGAARLSAAPRLSLLLPTGRPASDLGAGALGVQVNLPISVSVARKLVTHWNVGATVTPSARNAAGDRATTAACNLGASAVWLVQSRLNLLVELVWARSAAVAGPGVTAVSHELFASPGVRWAHDFPGGLQVVPGIAFPIGLGPSEGEGAVLLYLSFEHPFRSRER